MTKFFVWNGQYVQHEGTKESCHQYIRNSSSLFGVKGLTVVDSATLKQLKKGK